LKLDKVLRLIETSLKEEFQSTRLVEGYGRADLQKFVINAENSALGLHNSQYMTQSTPFDEDFIVISSKIFFKKKF